MYISDINAYIKSSATIQSYMGATPAIYPYVGYEGSTSPFIVYQWEPGIKSAELFEVRVDMVSYCILDIDAERGYQIREELIKLLNKADEIMEQIPSDDFRPLWCLLKRTLDRPPLEREGFYQFHSFFEIAYVPDDA